MPWWFAHSGGKLAIWIAWDEEECFRLWKEKRALLLELEAALKARMILGGAKGTNDVKKLQFKLEKLNARLDSLLTKDRGDGGGDVDNSQFQTPVAVFATFENSKSFDAAVRMKQLRMQSIQSASGGLTVSIKGAPEPENILWSNLQYTQKQRRIRVATIILCTVAVLLVGVWGIVEVRVLKGTFVLRYAVLDIFSFPLFRRWGS